MHDLSRLVSSNGTLSAIEDLFPKETYLVGGCVRDMLLGKDPQDFDIVTFSDVGTLAEKISQRLSSSAFWMDKKRGVVRISRKGSNTIDISSPKGKDIESDLRKRDITINAMGYDLCDKKFIDPVCGLADLDHGVIRLVSEENLRDDPARLVRCLRFSVVLGFPVAASTVALLKKHASRLRTVSAERVKQEFIKALCGPNGSSFFALMETTGLIDALFPNIRYQDISMALRGLRSALFLAREIDGLVYDAEKLLPGSSQELAQEVEAGLSRACVLRLAVFVSGILHFHPTGLSGRGPDSTVFITELGILNAAEICSSLRFSSRAVSTIKLTLASQKLAQEILSQRKLPIRAVHLLCEVSSSCLPEVLLLALAWKRSAGEATFEHDSLKEKIQALWSHFLDIYQVHKQSLLIDGNDIMQTLDISAGPVVGRLLQEVQTARAEGIVNTREEAIEHLHVLRRAMKERPDVKRYR